MIYPRPRAITPLLMLLFLVLSCVSLPAFEVSIPSELGTVPTGEVISVPWTIVPSETWQAGSVLTLTSACPCVTVFPALIPYQTADQVIDVQLTFDTAGYAGRTEKLIIIEEQSGDGNVSQREIVSIFADITAQADQTNDSSGADDEIIECKTCSEIEHLLKLERLRGAKTGSSPSIIPIEIFFSAGCRECERLLGETLPAITAQTGRLFQITTFDIMTDTGYQELMTRLESSSTPVREFPVLVTQGVIIQGFDAIESWARDGVVPDGAGRSDEAVFTADPLSRIAPIPVFLAGLADGVNPCAFSTLIFLLSVLALAGRSRREIALIGIVFTITVFITYMAAGLGLFAAVRQLQRFPLVADIIKYLLFTALCLLSLLSLRDARIAEKGRPSDMVLQLPDVFKKNIHRAVRTGARSSALFGGTVAMGVLVSIFELACTGQVYLPTIAYMVRVQVSAAAGMSGALAPIALLLLYNVGFIIPLGAVFAVAFAGVTSKQLGMVFARRIPLVKIILALVFAGMALLTWFQ